MPDLATRFAPLTDEYDVRKEDEQFGDPAAVGTQRHVEIACWLLAASPVALAIPGTGSPAHLEENMAAASLTFTGDDLADLG